MAQQPARPAGGFDMARVTTGQKIMGVSALLLFIDLFLPWQAVPDCPGGFAFVCSFSGFSGLGVLVALLLIGLLVWEGMLVGGVNIPTGSISPALIGAGIGAAAVLFTLIKFLTSLGGGGRFGLGLSIAYGAFVGLLLALALGYGTWIRFTESKVAAAGPSGPAVPPPPAP
jgi:hypothetical protein